MDHVILLNLISFILINQHLKTPNNPKKLNKHFKKSFKTSFPKLIFSKKRHGSFVNNLIERSSLYKMVPQVLLLEIINKDAPLQRKTSDVRPKKPSKQHSINTSLEQIVDFNSRRTPKYFPTNSIPSKLQSNFFKKHTPDHSGLESNKANRPNVFFNSNFDEPSESDQQTADTKTAKTRYADLAQRRSSLSELHPMNKNLTQQKGNFERNRFSSKNSPKNSLLVSQFSQNNKTSRGHSLMKDHFSYDKSIFHSQSFINESINPVHIDSYNHLSEIEGHFINRNHEIIGVYLNQHLDYGDNANDGYVGDQSVFAFRFINHNLHVYKANPNNFRYFKASSQGIFIGRNFFFI